jgi:hypothetical protein
MDKFIVLNPENNLKTLPSHGGRGWRGGGNLMATLTPSPSPIKKRGMGLSKPFDSPA